MLSRSLGFALVAFALALFASQSAFAEEKKADKPHEGKIVQAGDGKLTMTDKDGANKHTHNVSATATITCDGKTCKLEDLRDGYFVKVTTEADDKGKKQAVKIEARTKE